MRTHWRLFHQPGQDPQSLIAWWTPGLTVAEVRIRQQQLVEAGLLMMNPAVPPPELEKIRAEVRGRDIFLLGEEGRQMEVWVGAGDDTMLREGVDRDGTLGLLACLEDLNEHDPAGHLTLMAERLQLLGAIIPARICDPPSAGRNDPCPCGSGKKFKRCCA